MARPPSGSFQSNFRTDLHVHWLGRDDAQQDLGYAAVQDHPGGGQYDYCARCRLDERAKRRTPTTVQTPARDDETQPAIPRLRTPYPPQPMQHDQFAVPVSVDPLCGQCRCAIEIVHGCRCRCH